MTAHHAMPPAPPPAGSGAPPEASHPLDAALQAEREALRALFPLPPPRASRGGQALRNGGAAALVLAVATGALLWADPAWRTEHHASAIGERRDVRLADGSTLTLDTATALDVAWHLRSRRVALSQGQARFAVAPSAWRPFEVAAAGARSVRACLTGRPVSATSAATKFSKRASMPSAMRCSHCARSATGMRPQGPAMAVRAACTAASTSAALASQTSATVPPSTGLTFLKRLLLSTKRPPM